MGQKAICPYRCALATVMAALVLACTPKAMQPLSRLDTPEHHAATGIRLLQQEHYAAAEREFDLALKGDPRYAKAVAGVGLLKACRGDFAGAREALEQALIDAHSSEEMLFVLAGQIRVQALSRAACLKVGTECSADDGRLLAAKETYARAIRIDPAAAAAHYYMGECFLTALDLEAAGRMFSRVLDLNRGYTAQADARWKLLQKIQRAQPGTAAARKIVLSDRITRAELAALLMGELRVDLLYALRTPGGPNPALIDRERTGAAAGPVADIGGHPLQAEVEGVLRVGIRGLGLYPDGTFRPEEPVDRAGFAALAQELLVRLTGDGTLATRYVGSRSPFPDVGADFPYFNAAVLVTSLGIMEAGDALTGAFAPYRPVGGADALLMLRKVREELR
ncbi:MAG: S-layer homology domain-containing protein [Syntrophales bacterium]